MLLYIFDLVFFLCAGSHTENCCRGSMRGPQRTGEKAAPVRSGSAGRSVIRTGSPDNKIFKKGE